jgi:hypothetical protein
MVNGQPVSSARKMVMQPTDEVMLATPDGGYGRAAALAARGRMIAKTGKNALRIEA